MLQIRKNVFETNSSSTHSLCICTEDEYSRWQKGEVYYHHWNDEFVSKEEVLKELRENKYLADHIVGMTDEEILSEYAYDEGYYSEDQYFDSEYLETYHKEYISPSGDKIVVFGKYGYDG